MSAALRDATERVAATKDATLRTGRVLVWSVVGAFLVLELVLVALHAMGNHSGALVTDGLRTAFGAFLVWRALSASVLARRFLAFSLGAGALIGMVAVVDGPGPLLRVVMTVVTLVAGTGCWVFGASGAAREYMEAFSRSQEHAGPAAGRVR